MSPRVWEDPLSDAEAWLAATTSGHSESLAAPHKRRALMKKSDGASKLAELASYSLHIDE